MKNQTTITKTFREWREFNLVAQNYQLRTRQASTKLAYAIDRVQDRELKKHFTDYNKKIRDIRIDNCFTDKDGVIVYDVIRDERGNEVKEFRYTKPALKKKEAEEKNLLEEYDTKEITIEPFICQEVPAGLSEFEVDTFKGVIIPSDYVFTETNHLKVLQPELRPELAEEN